MRDEDQNQQDQQDQVNQEANFYSPEDVGDEYVDDPYDEFVDEEISWQASEYIHHDKGMAWSVILAVGAALLAGVMYFILRDYSIVVLILVMAVAVYVYGNRKPRTLNYTINSDGIKIGDEVHSFSQFRAFSVIHDDGIFSIELSPLQRFKPVLSIYFAPQDGDKIVDILSAFLPLEEKVPDYVDRIVKKIRF